MTKLLTILLYKMLGEGYRTETIEDAENSRLDAFRPDAKTEGDKVVPGHLVTRPECRPPWVYRHGESFFGANATLELLASPGCVRAFLPQVRPGTTTTVAFTGMTDNKGNSHLLSKPSPTKSPTIEILMELAAHIINTGTRVRPHLVPGDQNQRQTP